MNKVEELRKAILSASERKPTVNVESSYEAVTDWQAVQGLERKRVAFVDLVYIYASEWHRHASNHISDARFITEIVADAMRVDPACLPDLPFTIEPDVPNLAECAIAFVDCWTAKGGLPEPAWLRYQKGG